MLTGPDSQRCPSSFCGDQVIRGKEQDGCKAARMVDRR